MTPTQDQIAAATAEGTYYGYDHTDANGTRRYAVYLRGGKLAGGLRKAAAIKAYNRVLATKAAEAALCTRCEEAQASPGHDDCEACRAALAVMEQDQAGCTDPHLDRDTDRCRCGGEWVWHDAAQRHGCEAEVNPQPAVYSVDGEVVDLDELAADEGFSSADLKTIRNLHPGQTFLHGYSWAGEPGFTLKRER